MLQKTIKADFVNRPTESWACSMKAQKSINFFHFNEISFQDAYAPMRDLYYKNGEGFLFVYSVTDTSSIEDVKERYDSLLKNRVGLLHPPIHRCPQRG